MSYIKQNTEKSQYEKLSTFVSEKNVSFNNQISYYKFVWVDANIGIEEN